MKKIFYLFLLPILLVGCSKETEKLSEPSPVGGMISVHSQREFSDGPLSASAIHSDVFTRVAGDAVLAYTFEAWTRDANPRCVLHKTVTGTLTEAVFEIALIPGNYDFLFWADFGKGYYNTSDLRQISFDGFPICPVVTGTLSPVRSKMYDGTAATESAPRSNARWRS